MKFISLKFILFFCSAILLEQNAYSRERVHDCTDCMGTVLKQVAGLPDSKPLSGLMASAQKTIEMAKSPKESYQDAFCMQFEASEDTVDVETILEDMEASPYSSSLSEFWSTPACNAPIKSDTTVPILFNTASSAFRSQDFPKVVHDYFVLDKKNPEAWLNAINTKTSDGLTFLDFMQVSSQRGNYTTKPMIEAAARIVSYLCKNGGVYSKYRETSKCPQ